MIAFQLRLQNVDLSHAYRFAKFEGKFFNFFARLLIWFYCSLICKTFRTKRKIEQASEWKSWKISQIGKHSLRMHCTKKVIYSTVLKWNVFIENIYYYWEVKVEIAPQISTYTVSYFYVAILAAVIVLT